MQTLQNLPCRFNFGHSFTKKKTIIAKPLPKDMNEEERKKTLEERELILTKVKKFINEFLNPADSSNFKGDMTVDQILSANIILAFQQKLGWSMKYI